MHTHAPPGGLAPVVLLRTHYIYSHVNINKKYQTRSLCLYIRLHNELYNNAYSMSICTLSVYNTLLTGMF